MPSESAADELPLYQQVKDFIVARVLSGAWPEGTRVPSENELVAEFGVSRMTVHRALRELTAAGWLTRVQGAGSFVAEQKPQSALLEIRNIRAEIMEREHRHASDVLRLAEIPAEREIAKALDVRQGRKVFHSILLHRENGVPIQVEERHVNPAFAPRYLEQDFTRITPYEYLTELGPLDAAEHIIEAVLPNAEVQRLLGLGLQDPCLLMTRRTWSNGLVVSRARLTYPGGRYRLIGRQDYAPAPPRAAAQKTTGDELR